MALQPVIKKLNNIKMNVKKVKTKKLNTKVAKAIDRIKLIEKYMDNTPRYPISHLYYSKILAREILITEAFVNRLVKLTQRPIVVVGIESTGIPYTWTIHNNKNKKISLNHIIFHSCQQPANTINPYKDVIIKYREKLKNPLFLFVDASKDPKMPASFVGKDKYHKCGVPQEKSIQGILDANKVKTKLVGYNWSMQDSTKYLTKDVKNVDAILFNPIREQEFKKKYTSYSDAYTLYDTKEYAAFHDDEIIADNKLFKEQTLARIKLLKHNLFNK